MLYNTLLGCALLFCFLLWMGAITLDGRIQKIEETFADNMAQIRGHVEMVAHYRKEMSDMLDSAKDYSKEIPQLANKLEELRTLHARTLRSHDQLRTALKHYRTDKVTFDQYLREQERLTYFQRQHNYPLKHYRRQTCCAHCRHCNLED